MQDILFASDIHVGDYPDFNITFRSRMQQFPLLGKRLVEIGKARNAKILCIAGDILDRSTNRPYIVHSLLPMLDILCDYFDDVYYILGQHDLDSKTADQKAEDSYITALRYPNFHYMDKKEISVDGKRIAFMNWKPDQDLTWIEGKVDLFVGHATIVTDDRWAQSIDNTKFELGIFGDIHKAGRIDNMLNIGNPLQKDMRDQVDGTIVVYNTGTGLAEHVQTDPEKNTFLRIYTTHDRDKEGWESDLVYYKYKPMKVDSEDSEMAIPQWEEIDELVSKIMIENNLEDLHKEISLTAAGGAEVDFNFQLNKIRIEGFRSIKKMEYEFNPKDRIIAIGENGSGKSSFILALYFGLQGNRYLNDFVHLDMDYCDIEIELTYKDRLWKFLRSTRGFSLTIDGNPEEFNNKKEFNEYLEDNLPFLNFLDVMYLQPESPTLLNKLNNDRRVFLFNKFHQIDRIEELSKEADKRARPLENKIEVVKGKINDSTVSKDTLDSELTLKTSMIKLNIPIETLQSELTILQGALNSWNSYQEALTLSESKRALIKDYTEKIANTSIEVSKLSSKEIYEASVKTNTESLTQYKSLIEGYDADVKNIDHLVSSIASKTAEIIGKQSNLDKILESKCYVCNEPLQNETYRTLSESTSIEIRSLNQELTKFNTSMAQYASKELILENKTLTLTYITTVTENIKVANKGLEDLKILNTSISVDTTKLNLLTKDLEVVMATITEVVTKPDESSVARLTELTTEINLLMDIDRLTKEVSDKDTEIIHLNYDLEVLKSNHQRFLQYKILTNLSGVVYEQIYKKIFLNYSNDSVRFTVNRFHYRGKWNLELGMDYQKSPGIWVRYHAASSGQRILCDLLFESILLSNCGLLMLDEYLKHLDDIKILKGVEILNSINVGTMILSTHENKSIDYTRRLNLELVDGNTTIIE